jgi:hypothetical protein
MIMTLIGAVIPRLVLAVGWTNDPQYWGQTLLGGPLLFIGGWLLLPCTTLVYGIASSNGMSVLNWIFLAMALLIDLGTWGVGALAARKETSNFR